MDLYIDYPNINEVIGVRYTVTVSNRRTGEQKELIDKCMYNHFLERIYIIDDLSNYKVITVEIFFQEGPKSYQFILPSNKIQQMFITIKTLDDEIFDAQHTTVEVHINGEKCKDKTNWWQGYW